MTTIRPKIEPLFTLLTAIDEFFPAGGVTVSTLRTEIRKGNLQAIKIAGKYFITATAVSKMLEKCKVSSICQENASHPASTSVAAPAGPPSGSSVMDRAKRAQDALNESVRMLKNDSPDTSRKNTSLPKAAAIPLRSS